MLLCEFVLSVIIQQLYQLRTITVCTVHVYRDHSRQISVVCQLIFFILLGAMGDYGGMRKRMLIVCRCV
jgi:MFS-type transporter involved in bile tolerance (Atg22 family)